MTERLRVRTARDRRDLKRFIDLPYRLHARDPVWVPPLRRDVEVLLSRTKNPFFEHAEAEYFIAEVEGEVVGRIAAISNRLHNETHADRVGFFGFFESTDDQAVADALLAAAADWCRQHGHDILRGPASFSVNDECGLLVDGFDSPPTLMMPHNPRYYIPLLERAGFAKAKDLWVYQGGTEEHYVPVPERLARGTELIRQRQGITLRSLNMKDFQGEVERIKELYNEAWEKNWGFVPMTEHEIDHLAQQFKPVVIPEMVPMAEKDGNLIGFGIALPDLNVVFRRHRSGRLFPMILDLLWSLKMKRIRRARILLLGVHPEYRGKGIDAMLYHWIWTRSGERRIYWGEAGWILEDNPAMNAGLEKMTFRVYKTYRLYDRSI
ncbi:MAG TPA: GNAT family N-acetyltransferase [Gemmatimonadales bacterium]|nr:GNAT family N-acetyltransferase [Gemmatimonadales bacterium]